MLGYPIVIPLETEETERQLKYEKKILFLLMVEILKFILSMLALAFRFVHSLGS